MKNLASYLIPVALLLCAAACSSRPGGVLGKEKMAHVVADLSIADGIVESDPRSFPTDSVKLLFKQSIYKKHGVTPEEVDSSLRWYGYHMDKYLEVYDRAIEIVEENIATTTANAGAVKNTEPVNNIYATEGDSVDVWPGQRLRLFAANQPSDIIIFNVMSDRNWEAGDVYTLRTRTLGLRRPMRLELTAEYQDGTRDYVSTDLSGDGWQQIDLPLNPDKTASQVYGYISYTPVGGEYVIADSISLVRRRASAVTELMRADVRNFSSTYGR